MYPDTYIHNVVCSLLICLDLRPPVQNLKKRAKTRDFKFEKRELFF